MGNCSARLSVGSVTVDFFTMDHAANHEIIHDVAKTIVEAMAAR